MKNPPRRCIPRHVAIIMDGNGRWARQRRLQRIRGHERGTESVRAVVEACRQIGVKYLTLYAFSVENWVRPKSEINALMRILVRFLRVRQHELHKNHIRLRVTGRIEDLPDDVRRELLAVMDATRKYRKGHLILALSYGARTEITTAVRRIAAAVKAGRIHPANIAEETVSRNLYLPDVPDPDLLIRTSGEQRISNFLLWQISYTELYFTKTMWPDFRARHFMKAIREYARRHRRFGDVN